MWKGQCPFALAQHTEKFWILPNVSSLCSSSVVSYRAETRWTVTFKCVLPSFVFLSFQFTHVIFDNKYQQQHQTKNLTWYALAMLTSMLALDILSVSATWTQQREMTEWKVNGWVKNTKTWLTYTPFKGHEGKYTLNEVRAIKSANVPTGATGPPCTIRRWLVSFRFGFAYTDALPQKITSPILNDAYYLLLGLTLWRTIVPSRTIIPVKNRQSDVKG